MMKKYILIVAIGMMPLLSIACDICGCGIGNSYIGILPDFNKKILGMRYRYNSIFSHVGIGGATTYLTTKEIYRTAELWGGWNLTKKFRLMVSLPYNFNERKNQSVTTSKNGIGDITVSGMYQLLNTKKQVGGNRLFVQNLWVGGGIKLPTGKYNPADKSSGNEKTNLFQLGTGSVDFSVNAMYDLRLQDAGINLSGSYKMNTSNKYEYSYGNKVSASGQVYYKFRIHEKVLIAPNAGVLYESGRMDVDNGFGVDVSGGYVLLGTAGLETSFKKIAVGANWQSPFSQHLANGIVKANNRLMIHCSFLL